MRKTSYRDELKNLKIEALGFDGRLKLRAVLRWVHSLGRIIKVKRYSIDNAFKLAILKLKHYVSLWHKKFEENYNLKRQVQD